MNILIEDTDAVIIRSSRYVNGAEEVCVHYYSMGGGGGVVVIGSGSTHSKGNVGYEEAEEDNDGSSSSGSGKR